MDDEDRIRLLLEREKRFYGNELQNNSERQYRGDEHVRIQTEYSYDKNRFGNRSDSFSRERNSLQRGRDERGRDERGRDERGRIDRGRDDRGRDERGRDDRGRDDRGRDDRGRGNRSNGNLDRWENYDDSHVTKKNRHDFDEQNLKKSREDNQLNDDKEEEEEGEYKIKSDQPKWDNDETQHDNLNEKILKFSNTETKDSLLSLSGDKALSSSTEGFSRKSRWEDDDEDIESTKKSRWENDDDHEKKIENDVELTESSTISNSNQPIYFDSEENAEQEAIRKSKEISEIPETSEKKEIVTPVKKPTYTVPANINGCIPCRSVTNFERVCSVGQGAFGVVFKAKEKQTGEMVALKKVKMKQEKEGFPLTSVREIRILMQCKHINIVNVKEVVVGNDVDSIFIVMEYVEHDLKGLLEDITRNFTVSEVKCLLNQLLMGMEYLHDNWILHRDIKTSNLLLNNHGILKIADFGLARPYGSPIRPYTHVVVTLWYRAPELLLGTSTYTPAIDIWAVGCVFAEIISREPLFKGKNEADQLEKIFKKLGSVDNRIWPGFSSLPHAKNFNFSKKFPNDLRITFSEDRLSNKGLDLLNQLLCYSPEKRITAREALEHPYWEEAPLQKDPDLMPTWPSRTEGRKKRELSPEKVVGK